MARKLQARIDCVQTIFRVPKDDTTAAIVGRVLREARERAGLTRDDVAANGNRGRSYLSDVGRGRASLSVERLLRVCQGLGVSAAEIIQRVEAAVRRP